MLLFESKGRPENDGNDFCIQSKKNICVECEEKNHYLQYRTISSCYRMHFPEHLKLHRSDDIVLLCVDCHEIAPSAADMYKRQVAEEFAISLFVREKKSTQEKAKLLILIPRSVRWVVEYTGVSPFHLQTGAIEFLCNGSSMPPKRCDGLMEIVETDFGGREVYLEDEEIVLWCFLPIFVIFPGLEIHEKWLELHGRGSKVHGKDLEIHRKECSLRSRFLRSSCSNTKMRIWRAMDSQV